ncbi:MAG: nucleotidyltransferase family protein [Pseudomonadota bacterium]
MKAMILAAGRGERLRPLTDTTPKPLVRLGGKPLLEHQLGWLAAAGIRDVVINLHHLGQQIVDTFGDGRALGVRISYSLEPELLETGGGVVKALPLLGSEPFVVLNGDIFTDFDFTTLPATLDAATLAHLVVTPKPRFRCRGDFATDGARITGRHGDYLYCGIGVVDPAALEGYRAEPFSLREVLFALLEQGRLGAQVWHGAWTDVGTPAQLEALVESLAGHRPREG